MFVDFNRVFKGKPQSQLAVPPALIEYLNRSLPEGVKYVADETGNCVITGTDNSFTLGGFSLDLTAEQKKILGKHYTDKDVYEYSYNAQQPIRLSLIKDGYVLLNGQEFPVKEMAYNPLASIKCVSGSFWLSPPRLPDPFEIKVGCDKYERTLKVSRVPNNSISIWAFESEKEEPLCLKYFADRKTQRMTLNISLNLGRAKSVKDIVESTSIYNAYLEGKGTLLGQKLNSISCADNGKKFNSNSILFWEKVLKIEEYLEVSFIPPKDDVDFHTACVIEQLYQNLIHKIPVRNNQKINYIDGEWDFNDIGNDMSESIGKPFFFEFEAVSELDLFGVKIEVPSLICIFDALLQDCIRKGEKQRLVLADESEEKERYTSTMCFKTEEELAKYKTKGSDDIITLFHDAKRVQEYL